MSLKALIFDFDGLILDTETAELEIWIEKFANHGFVFDLEAHLSAVGSFSDHHETPDKQLAKLIGRVETADEIFQSVMLENQKKVASWPPLPGVVPLLAKAKANRLKLAVGSSSPRWWLTEHLQNLGLYEQFDLLISSEDVGIAKPAPDIYLRVMQDLHITPQEALVFEDSANGLQAALSAHIPAIVVPNPTTRLMNFSGAVEVLDSLADFVLEDYLGNP